MTGLVLADWWQAKSEMGHLLDAVDASEKAIVTGQGKVAWAIDNAFDEVATRCGTAAADVQDTGAQVSEASILPWHRSLGKAQDAYSKHNEAWQNMFSACADRRLSVGSTGAQIDATFRVAHRAFVKALPIADRRDRSRVEAIFKTTP